MHTVVAETSGSGVLPLLCENSTFALFSLSVRLRSMTAVAELFPERRLPSGVEASRSTVVSGVGTAAVLSVLNQESVPVA